MAKLSRVIMIYISLFHIVSLNYDQFIPKVAFYSASDRYTLGVVAIRQVSLYIYIGPCNGEVQCVASCRELNIPVGKCYTKRAVANLSRTQQMGVLVEDTDDSDAETGSSESDTEVEADGRDEEMKDDFGNLTAVETDYIQETESSSAPAEETNKLFCYCVKTRTFV